MIETAAATLRDPFAIAITFVATFGLVALGQPWSIAIPAGLLVLTVHFASASWLAHRRTVATAEAAGVPDWKRFGLTRKEIEVVRLVVLGLPYREIAGRTFNSERTIENHVDHIKRKLGVHSRAEIIAFAVRHGLLGPDDLSGSGGTQK